MTIAPARLHTDAVAEKLQVAGLLVGRGGKPSGGGWQGEAGESPFEPYVVLYPSPGRTDGDLGDPHEYLDYLVQCTCVAASQEGAEAVTDAVKTVLVGQKVTVTGRAVYPLQLLTSSPVTRDDQVSPPVHYAVVQFTCRSGPA